MFELEQRRITNSECQPDCQCSDWTNTLWFFKAASVCVHWLQYVKPYQKYHMQKSTALLYSANNKDQEPHYLSMTIKDA